MKKIKEMCVKNWFYYVAFMLPILITVIHCLVQGVWFSGSGSLLRGDTSGQLVPFYCELWNKVHSGDSFAHTWHAAGGVDFSTMSGYLISPFTLLILLCPESWVPDMVQVVMLLKWGLTSFTMTYFFYHTKHNTLTTHKKAVSLFLGLAYALGNSLVNFVGYLQFMDVMYCFPILLLLLEKMVSEKKWKLYYIVLTFCMCSNLYLMYGVCIFLILWFVLQLDKQTKEKWKKFFLFAGVSCLAAITCLGNIISGLGMSSSRLETASEESTYVYARICLLDAWQFIESCFAFNEISLPAELNPNIYCSIFAFILVFFFFFISIGKKKKFYMLSIFVMFICSFFWGALNLFWHIFVVPNGVYHRFSNLYIFILLLLVLYVLIHMNELKIWHVLVVGTVVIGLSVYSFMNIEKYADYKIYLVNILLIVLYITLLILFCKKSISYSNMLLVIVVFGVLELSFNASFTIDGYDSGYIWKTPAMDLFDDAELEYGERISGLLGDGNNTLVSQQDSDNGFISTINGKNMRLHSKLGLKVAGAVSYGYSGGSPFLNLFFNNRYAVSSNYMSVSDVEEINSKDDFTLYRMKRLAGLGYMVKDNVLEWDLDEGNCFDLQNTFVDLAVDGEPFFEKVLPELHCENAIGEVMEDQEMLSEMGTYMYENEYAYGNEYDGLVIDYIVDEDMDLYMYTVQDNMSSISVFIDDEIVCSPRMLCTQETIHIGNVKKGQKITICQLPNRSTARKGDKSTLLLQFAKFNEDAYAKSYEKLCESVYDIEVFESDYVKGSIQAKEAGLMMTSIQALEGWTVYVDGKEVQYETIADTMIAVPLDTGEHIVEFQYETPGQTRANTILVCGLALYCILCGISSYRKKKHVAIAGE